MEWQRAHLGTQNRAARAGTCLPPFRARPVARPDSAQRQTCQSDRPSPRENNGSPPTRSTSPPPPALPAERAYPRRPTTRGSNPPTAQPASSPAQSHSDQSHSPESEVPNYQPPPSPVLQQPYSRSFLYMRMDIREGRGLAPPSFPTQNSVL